MKRIYFNPEDTKKSRAYLESFMKNGKPLTHIDTGLGRIEIATATDSQIVSFVKVLKEMQNDDYFDVLGKIISEI